MIVLYHKHINRIISLSSSSSSSSSSPSSPSSSSPSSSSFLPYISQHEFNKNENSNKIRYNAEMENQKEKNILDSTKYQKRIISRSVYPENSKKERRGMLEGKSYLAIISADRLILVEVRLFKSFSIIC